MPEDKSQELNKDDSGIIKLLADVSKQNSDSITKQTESITKLTEGQTSIVKTLGEINETIKNGVTASDNNNPTGPGVGMEQKPKVESDKDVGAKTTAPNAYAPGEYGSAGREGAEPGQDKGGLKMENKNEKEGYPEKKEEEPKKEETKTDDKPKEEEKTHKEDKPKEEEKTHKEEEPKKEEKYKSFNYEHNEPLRPAIMTKSFESYPDGYQIIKAALDGWGIEGVDAEGSYVETLKRLDNREFGSFGQDDTGGSYY